MFRTVAGRRRSNRLIESPWVFSWKKKEPVSVDLEDEENRKRSTNLASDKLSQKEAKNNLSRTFATLIGCLPAGSLN